MAGGTFLFGVYRTGKQGQGFEVLRSPEPRIPVVCGAGGGKACGVPRGQGLLGHQREVGGVGLNA